jgi:phosphoribosylformylglycinamidine synthase subunit PurQ / glutaminase
MKAAVLLFPGSNREGDMARAVKTVTGHKAEIIWHSDHELPKGTDIVILPGGFSYGDYLRCGAIAARSNIMEATRKHAAAGGLVLGVCNGFQILCESGLLPGVMMRNRQRHFICKIAEMVVENNDNVFLNAYKKGQVLKYPIAHGEGNFVADAETLAKIEGEGRVLMRYTSDINGSTNKIVGILNDAGNVAGLMPHPENHVDPLIGAVDGRGMFESILKSLGG